MNVIINGNYLYQGNKDAWRAGIVVEGSLDVRGPTQELVTVVCQPRGRERKARINQYPVAWLLMDTPAVRAKLAAHGIIPEEHP